MATVRQITCINKRDRFDPHERIRAVGGVESNGSGWKLSQEEAITGIERGDWQFYVSVGGSIAWVIVATRDGKKYLKTENDGEQPNNLLSLPEC